MNDYADATIELHCHGTHHGSGMHPLARVHGIASHWLGFLVKIIDVKTFLNVFFKFQNKNELFNVFFYFPIFFY